MDKQASCKLCQNQCRKYTDALNRVDNIEDTTKAYAERNDLEKEAIKCRDFGGEQ